MKKLVAIAQMTSTDNVNKNLLTCEELTKQAALRSAKLLCFPENFAFLGDDCKQSLSKACSLDGSMLKPYLELAAKYKIYLSLGGFLEKCDKDGKTYNTHLIINDQGKVIAVYRKIHLFSLNVESENVLNESKIATSGNEITTVDSPVGILGLSICYDLRFSGLYWSLIKKDAQVLLIPAAFIETTGKAHWEILLRARAIETQSYVVAAAQSGTHNAKRSSYGHAMIVDPWGNIIAQCSEGTGIACAEINLEYLAQVRKRIPVFKDQRPDIYYS